MSKQKLQFVLYFTQSFVDIRHEVDITNVAVKQLVYFNQMQTNVRFLCQTLFCLKIQKDPVIVF